MLRDRGTCVVGHLPHELGGDLVKDMLQVDDVSVDA